MTTYNVSAAKSDLSALKTKHINASDKYYQNGEVDAKEMYDLAKQIMTMKDAIAIIEGDEDYTAMSENDIASAKSVAAKYAAK